VKLWLRVWCLVFLTHGVDAKTNLGIPKYDPDPPSVPSFGGGDLGPHQTHGYLGPRVHNPTAS